MDKIKLTLEISKKEKIYLQKVQEWNNLANPALKRYAEEALNSSLDRDFNTDENAYIQTDAFKKLKKEFKEASEEVEKTFQLDKNGNIK